MKKNKVENRGGSRPGSGRKKSGRQTKTISFRVGVEDSEPLKKLAKAVIISYSENQ